MNKGCGTYFHLGGGGKDMLSVVFFFAGETELNISPPPQKKKKKKKLRALQAHGLWMLSDTIQVLFLENFRTNNKKVATDKPKKLFISERAERAS